MPGTKWCVGLTVATSHGVSKALWGDLSQADTVQFAAALTVRANLPHWHGRRHMVAQRPWYGFGCLVQETAAGTSLTAHDMIYASWHCSWLSTGS